MLRFLKTCKVGCDFKSWLEIPGGRRKMIVHADQTLLRSKIFKVLSQ